MWELHHLVWDDTLRRRRCHHVHGHMLWHWTHTGLKLHSVTVEELNSENIHVRFKVLTFDRMFSMLLTHKHQPKATVSYLVGEGGGEARSEVICSVKAHKTFTTSSELKLASISRVFDWGPCCCRPCCTGEDGRCWPSAGEAAVPPPTLGWVPLQTPACQAPLCWCCWL